MRILASVLRAIPVRTSQNVIAPETLHLLLWLVAEFRVAHFLPVPVDEPVVVFVHALLLRKGRESQWW